MVALKNSYIEWMKKVDDTNGDMDAPNREKQTKVYLWNTFSNVKKTTTFHLTRNEEIAVEFAGDTTADVICVFPEGGEFSRIRDVPKSTTVVVWRCENLVTAWGEVRYVGSSDQENQRQEL